VAGGRILDLRWEAPGPVARAFYEDERQESAIMGPNGSGKTTANQAKHIKMARKQRRSRRDGVRRYKLCVVVVDYRRLWENFVPSWVERLPKDFGEWHGGKGEPAHHIIRFDEPDGSRVEFHTDMIALGDQNVEDATRGYMPTSWWLYEADRLPHDVLIHARGRLGRYPSVADGGPTWAGITMDLNAPDVGSWFHTSVYETRLQNADFFGFHRQPSGLSPKAENTKNLSVINGIGYYDRICRGQPDWWIRRFVRNEFGYSRAGKPVWEEFAETRHVALGPIEPAHGVALRIGMDAGYKPAAVLGQHMPNGQRRVLADLVTDADESVGPQRFGERLARLLAARFPGFGREQIIARADPSAVAGEKTGEGSWIQIVASTANIDIRPARTNDPIIRRDAVARWMTKDVDPDVPGLLLDPRCVSLARACASGYRFRRKQGQDREYHDDIDKNQDSHVADAFQYFELTDDGYLEMMGRKRSVSGPRQTRAIDDETSPRGEWERPARGRQSTALEE
jgi:hypothetical protein